MIRRWRVSLLAALLGACGGIFVEPSTDCAAACATADACGFLPSNLGVVSPRATAEADCLARCERAPADDAVTRRLLDCLASTRDDGWCADAGATNYALGLQCPAAAECFDRMLADADVVGPALVEVAVVDVDEFLEAYGADGLADLDDGSAAIYACSAAPCGEDGCTARRDRDDPTACDPTMCGREAFQIAGACGDLAATTIEVAVDQGKGLFARTVVYDGGVCTSAAASFADDADLQPGPARATARVTGTRTAGDLRAIDYPVADDVPDAESVVYCLEFPGQRRLLRSGGNRLLVPIAELSALAERGLTPTPCSD